VQRERDSAEIGTDRSLARRISASATMSGLGRNNDRQDKMPSIQYRAGGIFCRIRRFSDKISTMPYLRALTPKAASLFGARPRFRIAICCSFPVDEPRLVRQFHDAELRVHDFPWLNQRIASPRLRAAIPGHAARPNGIWYS
jgi:hypothetical protein